jgi:uncharacterized cupin superfamily protein
MRWALLVVLLAAGCADLSPLEVQTSHVFHDDLHAAGIPADWVREGQPRARVKYLARSEDEGVTAALWDCTAGKFEWYFASDELVHVLEGEVIVTMPSGVQRTLTPGSVAYFPAGVKSLWHVPKYVKKMAVLRDNSESFVRKAKRKVSELFASN